MLESLDERVVAPHAARIPMSLPTLPEPPLANPVRLYCPRCGGPRLCFAVRWGRGRHAAHLALTVFTLGVWGVGWIACALYDRVRPYRCNECARRIPRGRTALRIAQRADD
ncbi:MAG: hypothetical protein AB7Q17_05765 [Phycisphaerae bacterium]